jgi:hypothetical protein
VSSTLACWLTVSAIPMSASRGGAREQREHRHRDQPGGDDGVAKRAIRVRRSAVEPDQGGRHDDELGGQVEVAQEKRDCAGVERALHRALNRHSDVPLELEDPAGVLLRLAEVPDEDPAGHVVDDVGREEEQQLGAPAAPRQPRGGGRATRPSG